MPDILDKGFINNSLWDELDLGVKAENDVIETACKAFPQYKLAPMLFYPLGSGQEQYIVNDFANYADDFGKTLQNLVNDILSPQGSDFEPCSDIRKCEFCKYAPLCNRN